MLLKDFITRLANRTKLDENGTDERGVSIRQRLIDKINESYLEIGMSHDWKWLERTSEIQTVPNYVTGTVTITNGSRQAVGSGTAWTSDFQGRYFQPMGSSQWYKISSVDVTNQYLYLTLPISEASSSGTTYTVWKRFYFVNSEVDRITDFESWMRQGFLIGQNQRQIQDISSNISNTGQPDFLSTYGVNSYAPIYSTGNVTIPKDSNVLTGSGTLWLANVEPGDIVIIGSYQFRVKNVDSDTQITLYNYAPSPFSDPSAYTINKDNPLGFQLYYSPDKAYNFPYTYIKKVFPMISETKDRPEFPDKFDNAILDGAEYRILRDLKDTDWQKKESDYINRIIDLKNRGFVSSPRVQQFRPYIPNRRSY